MIELVPETTEANHETRVVSVPLVFTAHRELTIA